MQLKLLITIMFTLAATSNFIATVEGYCSLEKMKKFAMEACEHLFLADEPREKREISVEDKLNTIFGHQKTKRHSGYVVRRSNYPPGGYLRVHAHHFEKLSKINVHPMYKLHHSKNKHLSDGIGYRYKRDGYGSKNYKYLPYCCYHKCDEDFFC